MSIALPSRGHKAPHLDSHVHPRVEPILYQSIIPRDRRKVQAVLPISEREAHRSDRLLSHVRSLLLYKTFGSSEADTSLALLRRCICILNLAIGYRLSHDSDLLPCILSLPLRRLAVTYQTFGILAARSLGASPLDPWVQTLVHLDLFWFHDFNLNLPFEQFSVLTHIVCHLGWNELPDDALFLDVLARCPKLDVLIVPLDPERGKLYEHLSTIDTRFVVESALLARRLDYGDRKHWHG